jgi:hypothetical protein
MIRTLFAPVAVAAATYSLAFSWSMAARARRAKIGTCTTAIARTILSRPGPSAAANAMPQQQCRKGDQAIDDAHNYGLNGPAAIARQQAEHRANNPASGCREHAG